HWRLVRRPAFLAMGITTLLLATVSAGDLALREWSARQEVLHPVVVVAADGTGLRKGNGELYPLRSETPLNRGVEARLRFERSRSGRHTMIGRLCHRLRLTMAWAKNLCT